MSTTNKKTLILGASSNPSRYSYLALNRLRNAGHEVEAIGKKEENAGDVQIHKAPLPLTDIDTVTLYLNPQNQKQYYDYIVSLHPKRIIFNPGAENEELEKIAEQNNIPTMQACTLVLLATGQY
ncbi:CoA-binding protein [Terrimonas sp.]|uniref:CoA-binding protein n=1 Tax=Terrimonas sp. TaxID=1914338 RepID=UPI000D50E9FC|nr:CoA-binding protein [Terrimonas sp.]PVD50306.1 CoA-binding protein [Terrimonas sp.]